MTPFNQKRRGPRIVVGPQYGISFTHRGQGFRDLRLANLSLDGCFALLDPEQAAGFERGAVLTGLRLQHPELPSGPLVGTVAFILGRNPESARDLAGMGIHFLNMDEASRAHLARWVREASQGA